MTQPPFIEFPLPQLDEFILHLQADNFSPETVYNYERDLKTFEYFINQDLEKDFMKLSKTDIIRFKAYLTSTDRKTAAIGECKSISSGSSPY